jgi:competence protein ComEC
MAIVMLMCLASCATTKDVDTDISVYQNENNDSTAESALSKTQSTTPETDNAQTGLKVRFLDVGQADAALLESDGHYVLIDGGNAADSQLIYTVLKKEGVTSLDAIIATHPDEDHIGGLSGALNAASAKKAYCSTLNSDTKAFRNFTQAVQSSNISIIVPQTTTTTRESLEFGSAHLEFLGPLKDYGDENENSLVVKVSYKQVSFLFAGDVGKNSETDLAQLPDIEATVLKVPHHGSKYSSSYQFLRAVNPEYSVISVGSDNTYGHPTSETLGRLKDQGSKLFRTDLQGDITMTTDGEKITVATEKGQAADVYKPNDQNDETDPLAAASESSPSETTSGTANSTANEIAASQTSSDADSLNASADEASTAEPSAAQPSSPPVSDYDSSIVYITNSGKKYHLDGCRYLSKSKIPITRADAKAKGYTPCSTCNPG